MTLRDIRVVQGNEGLVFLLCLLASSLCLNVALGINVRRLASARERQIRNTGGIQVNTVLPSIAVADEDGNRRMLTFNDSRTTVLYVWRPSCSWCKLNEANIRQLAVGAGSRFRFIGLSTEPKGLKEYLRVNPLPFPVFAVDDIKLIEELGLNVTPQTAVVRPGGLVQQIWVGAFEDASQSQAEAFFDVKLPGLQPAGGSSQGSKRW